MRLCVMRSKKVKYIIFERELSNSFKCSVTFGTDRDETNPRMDFYLWEKEKEVPLNCH